MGQTVAGMRQRLVGEEDMPRSSVEDVVACVEQVRRSDLWKRIDGAEAVLTEVPFAIIRGGEDLPRTTTGTVDVAFREADEWVLFGRGFHLRGSMAYANRSDTSGAIPERTDLADDSISGAVLGVRRAWALGKDIRVWSDSAEQISHLTFGHLCVVGNLSPQPIAVGKTEKLA